MADSESASASSQRPPLAASCAFRANSPAAATSGPVTDVLPGLARTDVGTGSIDLYDTLVYGPESWGFGNVQSITPYFNTGAEKVSDPLNQIIATIGWKAWYGAIVLTKAGKKFARIKSAGV